MFVRWKKRKMTEYGWVKDSQGNQTHIEAGVPTGNTSMSAVLVENKRVNGKVKQKVICHLATIPDHVLGYANRRLGFWKRVDAKLDSLDIEIDRKAIESSIEKVVLRPTQEEIEQANQRRQEKLAEFGRGTTFLSESSISSAYKS